MAKLGRWKAQDAGFCDGGLSVKNEKAMSPSTVAAQLLAVCFLPITIAAAISIPDLLNRAQAAEIRRLVAEMKQCPKGVRQSHLKPDGELICVFDDRSGYGKSDRRIYVNGAAK